MGTAEFQIIMERLDRLEKLIKGSTQQLPQGESPMVITSFRERVKDSLARHALSKVHKSRRHKGGKP